MRNRESKVEPSKEAVACSQSVVHNERNLGQLNKSDAPASLASELECRYFPCAVHVQAVWSQAGFPLPDIVSQSAGCANGSPWPEETAIRVVSWLLGFFVSRRVDDMEVGGLEAN